MSARYALIAIVAFVAALSFAPGTRAQEAAGGPCFPGQPLDLEQGYRADIAAPIAIPDNSPGGLDNCMSVPAGATITGLKVSVTITHTYVGDLYISLYHSTSNRFVVLLDRPGVPATPNGCSGDNIRVTFDDSASAAAESECNPAPPAVYGFLRPEQALSAFTGDQFDGTWQLFVSDGTAADAGTLDSWSLLPTFGPIAANGDINCSTHTDAIDAALIQQLSAGFNFPVMCPENGDVNANGQLDAIDAALILQYDAGLILIWPPPPPIL